MSVIDPYVGPRPFDRSDEPVFFGRDREAKELLSLVIAHPVVLLYAQSGAGKTSLLNAKIRPLLERRRADVLGARVGGDLPPGLTLAKVANIYIFNALMSLASRDADPGQLAKTSLSAFLQPLESLRAESILAQRVLIFDQFEEIFTAFPERWRDRQTFFEELGAELEENSQLRVVFAMREEHIASLDPFVSLLPERLRTRFRLERLREAAALEAVRKPLEGTGRSFALGAAEKLVNNLLQVPIKSATGTIDISGEFVEPVQLQVVCKNLWHSLPEGVTRIEEQLIADYGDVDKALSGYYDGCLSAVVDESGIREGVLRRWFEACLITADRTRGTVYKDIRTTGGLLNEVVEKLENLRLVRTELRGGAPWYELTHDRFIAPILKSNQAWWQTRYQEKEAIEAFEKRALSWKEKGEPKDLLLSKRELSEVLRWFDELDAEELGLSGTFKEFAQASRMRAERVRAEGLRRQVAILAIALLLSVGLGAYALRARMQAEKERLAAENASFAERGRIAKVLAEQPGKEFDALSLAIRAVGPKLRAGGTPPESAIEGLRAATSAIGDRIWLRNVPKDLSALRLSRNGRYALAIGIDNFALWDLQGRKLIGSQREQGNLRILDGEINQSGWVFLALSVRRNIKASPKRGSIEVKQLKLFNPRKGVPVLLSGFVSSLKINDKYVAYISEEGNLAIRSAETGDLIRNFSVSLKEPSEIALSNSNDIVMWVGDNGLCRLWNIETGKEIAKKKLRIRGEEFWITRLSPDGRRIAWAQDGLKEGGVEIISLEAGRGVPTKPLRVQIASPDIRNLRFFSDDKLVVAAKLGFGDVEMVTIDATSGEIVSIQPFPIGIDRQLEWVGLGNDFLVVSSYDREEFFMRRLWREDRRRSASPTYDIHFFGPRSKQSVVTSMEVAFSAGGRSMLYYDDQRRWACVTNLEITPLPLENSLSRVLAQGCRMIENQPESKDPAIQEVCRPPVDRSL